ncbi:uncharacterized protein P174DRAFT_29996 [Aspergillus novofumigatus IBT 16806]|uniref:Uncharacterized protein n=1 Tax=Aspergillus novofumigatus (strain IBT 16806) TaxID=1392255 RepID=A0A2I1CMI0_ASPN1|nr:uncharacterized protein P174DRAFT_29996 [Aspergillus novofumigatus IBT 16806]PKX98805.1 hypothetical protein P174DRAFT_29996 [Aspergillus novofumigatus IBT 16806]
MLCSLYVCSLYGSFLSVSWISPLSIPFRKPKYLVPGSRRWKSSRPSVIGCHFSSRLAPHSYHSRFYSTAAWLTLHTYFGAVGRVGEQTANSDFRSDRRSPDLSFMQDLLVPRKVSKALVYWGTTFPALRNFRLSPAGRLEPC